MEITSTEAQNNFGQYLKLAAYENIIITKNGKKAAILKRYDEKIEGNNVSEIADSYKWDTSRITYEEFLKLTSESENRYEYIDGEVYLLASPVYEHQRLIVEMINLMYHWFKGKKCRPLTSPFDVTLTRKENNNKNVVQPDILVICDNEKINESGRYMGVPSLVVEVLSKSTKSKDMLKKLGLYMDSGVREYWIVCPANQEIYLYFFENNDIADYKVFKKNDKAESILFKGFEFSVKDLFES